jgi:hypothetical protein
MRKAPGKATDDQAARTEDGHVPVLLTRKLNSSLTVMQGRMQLLRRRLRQGGDTSQLETDLEAIETELARPTTIAERIQQRAL